MGCGVRSRRHDRLGGCGPPRPAAAGPWSRSAAPRGRPPPRRRPDPASAPRRGHGDAAMPTPIWRPGVANRSAAAKPTSTSSWTRQRLPVHRRRDPAARRRRRSRVPGVVRRREHVPPVQGRTRRRSSGGSRRRAHAATAPGYNISKMAIIDEERVVLHCWIGASTGSRRSGQSSTASWLASSDDDWPPPDRGPRIRRRRAERVDCGHSTPTAVDRRARRPKARRSSSGRIAATVHGETANAATTFSPRGVTRART